MLLESEPRPLGEDVAVRIPPVDDGKFVNRLNDAGKAPVPTPTPRADDVAKGVRDARPPPAGASAPAALPPSTPVAPGAAAPGSAVPGSAVPGSAVPGSAAPIDAGSAPSLPPGAGTTAPITSSGSSARSKYDTALASKDGAAVTAPPGPERMAQRSTAATDKPAPKATADKPASKGAVAPAAGGSSAATGGPTAPGASGAEASFAVQLAAFSDDKGANALAARLKRSGYSAYTEPLKTSRGTLYRVRVGPYPSKDAAAAARDKLKGEGQNGIVAPAH